MMEKQVVRLVVLISGNGSNLQAILDACANGQMNARVEAVISNLEGVYGLERARSASVPALLAVKKKEQNRMDYDSGLADLVAQFEPDWVVLAGWMRILSAAFLNRFPGRVINLHPALPGQFPGTHAIEKAFEAFQCGEIQQTGVMVHLVPDEGVDCGPVLGQEPVEIIKNESLQDLETRIHAVEHRLLVDTLKQVICSTDR